MCEKVLKIVYEFGYWFLLCEVMMMYGGECDLIVYLVDEILMSLYLVVNIDGVCDVVYVNGKLFVVYLMYGNVDIECQVFELVFVMLNLFGVVYVIVYMCKVVLLVELLCVLVVLFNCYMMDSGLLLIVLVEVVGGYVVIEYLLCVGYWCIGYVNGELWQDVVKDWLKGYCIVLVMVDILFVLEFVCDGDWGFDIGFEQMLLLLCELNLFIVIFCVNDLMVIGVIEVVKYFGMCVFDDILVFGYDDQEIVWYMYLLLLMIVLLNYELGCWVVEILLQEEQNCVVGMFVCCCVIKFDGLFVECGLVWIVEMVV